MDGVDVSPQFKTTSLSVLSPTALHIAALCGARLQIRSLVSFDIVHSIHIPSSQELRNLRIAWAPPRSTQSHRASTPPQHVQPPQSHRILVYDDSTTRVYDLCDEKWNAVISNGSGGMGKNLHVEFGASDEEVLVWSGFCSKVTVWCLLSGRTVELRDPKFAGTEGRGWGYRPSRPKEDDRIEGGARRNGQALALLCRNSGIDIMLLLAPRTYNVLRKVELQTVDAQDLRWSRDGRWLAVWDSPSTGYKLHIYTADGHLYRSISRESTDELNEWGIEGLGIKNVEWVPGNEYLSVGGLDRRVRILSTRTFAPVVLLDHTAQINVPSAVVYTEQVDAKGARTYAVTQQPAMPPKAVVDKTNAGLLQLGIGILAFNVDGTLCATRDDSTPSTVWIWDLKKLRPRTILIQHTPVKRLHWHPTDAAKLLVESTHDAPTLHLYTVSTSSSSSDAPPLVLDFAPHIAKPAGSLPTRWSSRWLTTNAGKKPTLLIAHQQSYLVAWPEGKDQILKFEGGDGNDSDDSLYDILTGRTPVPPLRVGRESGSGSSFGEDGNEEMEESTAGLEDTFREKRNRVERGGLGESGLDEMF